MWQTCGTFAIFSATLTLLLKSTYPHFKVFPEHRCCIWINSVLNANSHASAAKLKEGRNYALSFVQSCICKRFLRYISSGFQQFAGDKAVSGKQWYTEEKKQYNFLLRRIMNKSIQGWWQKALVDNTCIFLPYKIAVPSGWRKHPNCFSFSSFAYFGAKGFVTKPGLAPSACSTVQTPAHKPTPSCQHTFNSFDKNLFLFTGVFFFY